MCPITLLHRFSVCKISEEDNSFLIETLKGIDFKIYLAYRGSVHGFKREDFHKNCDMIGPNITLLQVENCLCIGGFTSENWESSENYVYKDD